MTTQDLIKRHTISADKSIREALAALNGLSGEALTLFVTHPDGTIGGTLTDGDIRRALVAGKGLDDDLSHVMHRNFLFHTPSDDLCMAIGKGKKKHVRLLPVIENGYIIDIIDLSHIHASIPVDAVMMAGGRGERLRPLTESMPKPLLPVGGKAIIDYNVEELEACDVKKIFVTVNYLADQIEEHFRGRRGRSEVICVREPARLGTLGSLSLIDGLQKDNVLVMNSDLLTNIDLEALYVHHIDNGADLTIAGVPYAVSVPFAIMQMEGNRVTALEEKPTYNYFANAGVYLMRRELVSRIEKGVYLDAPDFIASLICSGLHVSCHPAEGTWIDIGSPDDYRYANELMSRRMR